MELLIIIATVVAYLVVGLVYARRGYAIETYRASRLKKCASWCDSHSWNAPENKKHYCGCGFLKPIDSGFYIFSAFAWIVMLPLEAMYRFITGGTYEPKDVKAAREKGELQAEIKRLEKELKNPMYTSEDL